MTIFLGLPRSVRFLMVGGAAAALNWLVRFPLSAVLPYAVAVLGAAAIGMAFGFVAYRRFVFTGSDRSGSAQLRDFLLVNGVTTILVTVVAMLSREALVLLVAMGTAEALAHAIGIGAGAVGNYVGHGRITFRSTPEPSVCDEAASHTILES